MMKITCVSIFILMFSGAVFAQQKNGHINANEILQLMPETKVALDELERFSKLKTSEIQKMESEYRDKYNAAVAKEKTISEANKDVIGKELETIGKDLNDLKLRIETAGQKAQEEINAKQLSLFDPINTRFLNVLREVSKEFKLSYIFDVSTKQGGNNILIWDNGEDVSGIVKQKLSLIRKP